MFFSKKTILPLVSKICDMKIYTKWLLLLLAVVSFSPLFAQHSRYNRRYHDRYAYTYAYRPYRYAPVHTSVSVVARLPFGAVAVALGGRHYHYYDGIYYEPMPGGYAMVAPPVGIVVPVLPPGCTSVIIGSRPYYRYQSIYYMPLANSGYQVVPEPKEEENQSQKTADTNSNSGYEKLVLDNKTYYKKGSKYYKAKVNDDGEIIYEEAGETAN